MGGGGGGGGEHEQIHSSVVRATVPHRRGQRLEPLGGGASFYKQTFATTQIAIMNSEDHFSFIYSSLQLVYGSIYLIYSHLQKETCCFIAIPSLKVTVQFEQCFRLMENISVIS